MVLDKAKKIVVVGGGGIGGITAAYLKEASYDITIFDVDKAHIDSINNNGLFIDGLRGEKRIDINATTTLKGTYDIILLSVKSLHTTDALDSLMPHLTPNSIVVSLQNGINEDIISEKIGEERTIGCVIGWGATNVGPGHLTFTSEGQFIIGRLDGTIDPQLKELKNILETVTKTIIVENILGQLWSKLLINCCIATIGVCFAADVKKLVSNQQMIPIMVGLASELITVPQHAGIQLAKFEDILDMELFRINDFNDYKRAVAIMKMAGEHHKGIKSSMWQDIEKGRNTEIDYINGYVEKKAEKLGIPTPINKALIQLVKDIEKGKKTPSEENIRDFYKQVRIPRQWIEYNFDSDPYSELSIFNLPSHYKHHYAAQLTGLQIIGLLTAFSKAFERLTQSIIGKLFIRKKAWDIVNIVLSRYVQKLGEQFANNIQKNYNIKTNDTTSVIKIFSFLLNTQHINYTVETFTPEESIIFLFKEEDIYREAEKVLEVQDNIAMPIIIQLLQSITHAVNDTIVFDFKDELVEGKPGSLLTLTLK